jgi:hypothetical protein
MPAQTYSMQIYTHVMLGDLWQERIQDFFFPGGGGPTLSKKFNSTFFFLSRTCEAKQKQTKTKQQQQQKTNK